MMFEQDLKNTATDRRQLDIPRSAAALGHGKGGPHTGRMIMLAKESLGDGNRGQLTCFQAKEVVML
jgi:hypothetical protein